MSDTHDDAEAVRRAVAVFNSRGVSFVLHAGDISSPGLACAFQGLKAPFVGVCGNNDRDWPGLRAAFAPYGQVYAGYFDSTIGGVKVALMHELRLLHMLPINKKYDVVVYGHSHHFEAKRGSMLMVNPGQCKGLEPGEATVAILDMDSLDVEKLVLDRER